MVPDTTAEGLMAGAPWRAYRESVAAQSYEPNLDEDLPYIVALGLRDQLAPRLKAASERGYTPAWFCPQAEEHRKAGAAVDTATSLGSLGFYPYWIAFHTSLAPVASQSSTGGAGGGSFVGGFSGGGAAGGGGGSAGSF